MNRPRPYGALIGLWFVVASAWGAHYGTTPIVAETNVPTLRISNRGPLCPEDSAHCTETTGATRAYPVADGDRITIDWTSQPQLLGGVIELGHLYLPLDGTISYTATPITLTLQMPDDRARTQLIVEYGGTSHHVPLRTNVWQSITVYNPNERTIYVRLDAAPASQAAN